MKVVQTWFFNQNDRNWILKRFHSVHGHKASSIEAPCLHDTNLNTLSTQTPKTPRGQESLRQLEDNRHINKDGRVFIYRSWKCFKFHAQPQTGAYSCYKCIHPSATIKALFSLVWHPRGYYTDIPFSKHKSYIFLENWYTYVCWYTYHL